MSRDRRVYDPKSQRWLNSAMFLALVIITVMLTLIWSNRPSSQVGHPTAPSTTPTVIEEPVVVPVENSAATNAVAKEAKEDRIVGKENPDGSVVFQVSLKRLNLKGLASK